MLIIALPKSCSSSLATTLAKQHGWRASQRFREPAPIPAGYEILGSLHSDVREWPAERLRALTAWGGIAKQHLPPTAEHMAALRHEPKVILLRDVNDIPAAYHRAALKGHTTPPPAFADCESEADWFLRAVETGLLDELKEWRDGWLNEADWQPKLCHVVQYVDVIQRPQQTINQIEQFFGMRETEGVVLARKRFTRKH